MPELVCFIGVIGSGKDYRAKKLVEKGFIQVNFADALRELAWDILGWKPKDEQEYEYFKKSKISVILDEFEPIIDKYGREFKRTKYINFTNLTGRQFLQNLGSAMRKIDPNFWVDRWSEKVAELLPDNNICCSDLRFINELAVAYVTDSTCFDDNGDIITVPSGKNFEIVFKKIADTKFIFTNYISDRYNATDPHESEALAQRILTDGFGDGEELSMDYVRKLIEE